MEQLEKQNERLRRVLERLRVDLSLRVRDVKMRDGMSMLTVIEVALEERPNVDS